MSNNQHIVDMDESDMNESEQNTPEEEQEEVEVEETETSEAAENQASEEDASHLLEDAQQQAEEYKDKMIRMQAEMENLRKRTDKQVEDAHKYANDKFAAELLQVKDSLELGLSAEDIDVDKLREGTELTLKMLNTVFEKFSIEEVNPLGEAFDPNLHEAMTMQESAEHQPNTVLTVVQKGYSLHGRLVRPAMVIVSKAAS